MSSSPSASPTRAQRRRAELRGLLRGALSGLPALLILLFAIAVWATVALILAGVLLDGQ